MMVRPLRIANASGFYGDRFSAMDEQITGGPIDFVTGDYLAELTMLILWKTKQRGSSGGYATSFLRQMEGTMGECVDRGVKVVANAGGLDPAALAEELRSMASTLGIDISVAHIEGDDLMPDLPAIMAAGYTLANLETGRPLNGVRADPVTANVYLGAWGIVEALDRGADIVVCPRVTDASLVVGPAAWHHGWAHDDWDELAGAVVAGHVLECGAQATGGNYSFFDEIADPVLPGFPVAEVASDGSSVITKHDGTSGAVSIGTVTAQILYEIDEPAYLNPDVVAHFDTIELRDVGKDRVEITGVRGSSAPNQLKVAVNYLGGFRNAVTLGLVGLDVHEKAALVEAGVRASIPEGRMPQTLDFSLSDTGRPDADTNEAAASFFTVTARDEDPSKVGRAFANAVIELALASYPGFFALAPPAKESAYGVYWPTLVPRSLVAQEVVLEDGARLSVTDPPIGEIESDAAGVCESVVTAGGASTFVPLGAVAGARSGDKGGSANIGVWTRTDSAYRWLASMLTVDKLKELLPETADLRVERYELPNIRGLNFVVHRLLGEGVASSTRFDPQAKSLGEWLRSRTVEVPVEILDRRDRQSLA